MTCHVLLFAAARVHAGASALAVDLPEPATVRDLKRALGLVCPALAPLLPACRVAVDARYAEELDPVLPGVEVALIPPVSGGGAP